MLTSRSRSCRLTLKALSRMDPAAKFDLTLYCKQSNGRMYLNLVYNTALFSQSRMADFLEQFTGLLAKVAQNPDNRISAFTLLTPGARKILPDPAAHLSDEWHGAVHQLFSHHAVCRPEAPAIIADNDVWSYRELDEIDNRLASYLHDGGIGVGDVVAIYGHRSAPLVWAILGVLKTGAAYAILDPWYPAERLIACLEAVRPRGWLEIVAAGELAPSLSQFLIQLAPCCWLRLQERKMLAANDTVVEMPAANPGVPVHPATLQW